MPIGSGVGAGFDSIPVSGLEDAVEDSLAYRLAKIERHVNHYEYWFGAAVTPDGETHVADRIGPGVAAFQADAGDDDWGNWIQILGSEDTPIFDGITKHSLRQITFVDAEHKDEVYFFQVAFGEDAAAALVAGTYGECVIKKEDSGGLLSDVLFRRVDVGTKAWARTMCPDQNTATLDFFFSIIEYEG